MKNIKHNKVVARSIVLGGTIVAGLGIWIGVSHAALPNSSNLSATMAANVTPSGINFSVGDTFLTPSTVQNTSSISQSTTAQTTPAQTARLRTRGS